MPTNDLEKIANYTNLQYRKAIEALILNIPVPIIMTRRGFVAKKSTVDFTGLIKGGKFIAYDAKECMSKTSFPLSNIKEHQLLYLDMVRTLGGIAFFMIHFKSLYSRQVYITPLSLIKEYWNGNKRKSIPISDFKSDWLTPVDEYLMLLKKLIKENQI